MLGRLPARATLLAGAVVVSPEVRIAVVKVNSLINSGTPVSTSAKTPNAITVGKL